MKNRPHQRPRREDPGPTPRIASSKAEIVRIGLESNAPLDLTWSCYREEQPGGEKAADRGLFKSPGLLDSIAYAQSAGN